MGLRVVSLASGSSANCTLVEADDVRLIIDVGLSGRAVARELEFLGLQASDLTAILLTHEHGDHVRGARALAKRTKAPVVGTEGTLLATGVAPNLAQVLPAGRQLRLGSITITSFSLPHDGCDPVGYFVEHEEGRVCLATDLGSAPGELEEYLRAADLAVVEANHDRQWLINGPYPAMLKARILGKRGHLSNDECADLVVRAASGRPQWLWLAHLSETNNSPRQAERCVRSRLAQEGITTVSVQVALRDRRSVSWHSGDCWQQLPFGTGTSIAPLPEVKEGLATAPWEVER